MTTIQPPVSPFVSKRAVFKGVVEATGAPLFSAASASDSLQVRFGAVAGAAELPNKTEIQQRFIADIKANGILVSGGAGTMGNDIAMNAMNFGLPVYAQDMASKKGLVQAKMDASYQKALDKGVMTADQVAAAKANLRGTLGTLKEEGDQYPPNPALVIEAIPERLDWKQSLFKDLDKKLGPDTILATNTSSLSVDEIAEATGRPDKVIGIHYFLPANRNRFIEVIPGTHTSPETLAKTMAFVRAIGKQPIVAKDSPGFVVNRIGVPLINEGVRLYDELKTGDAAHDKQLATYIDQVAMETMWPTFSKKNFDALKEKVLLPIGTMNRPEYMGLIGEIVNILDEGLKDQYGKAYAPAATIGQKMAEFNQVNKDVGAEAKANGWDEKTYLDTRNDRLRAFHIPVGGQRVEVPAHMRELIETRLLASVFSVAGKLVDEGVATIADIERGVKSGFGWEVGPFELMNSKGIHTALEIITAAQEALPDLPMPAVLENQYLQNDGQPFDLNFVDSRREGTTQFITLNKPQRNNALDAKVLTDLVKAVKAADADPNVKTIVIESIGGKNFSAGADLPWLMNEVDSFQNQWWFKYLPSMGQQILTYKQKVEPFLAQGFNAMDEIAKTSKVTVAKVNGNALGGGTELALACDYIIAGESANVGLPEVLYGIFPAWGGTERLPKRIGEPLAKWMILNGGFMKRGKGPAILNGKDAATIGVVDKVVPDLELDRAVQDFLASPQATQKPVRDGSGQDVSGTRFEALHWRYKTAPLGELLEKELAGYYNTIADEGIRGKMKRAVESVMKLANRRIEQGLDKHPPKDLQSMVANLARVDGLTKAAAKAAKAAAAATADGNPAAAKKDS